VSVPPVDVRRHALASVTPGLEALQDGELDLAEQILDDLGAGLWSVMEREAAA
jgi:hypothetical protein